MTIKFLLQSPDHNETTQEFQTLLASAKDGRLYILTGSVSSYDGVASELASAISWAANQANREIVLLIGIFADTKGKYTASLDQVVTKVGNLFVKTINALRSNSNTGIAINVQFVAVRKWHAKAIGLSGRGKDFLNTDFSIFGSTNFTEPARHGDNYEFDTCIINDDQDGAGPLIRMFATKLRTLIHHGFQHNREPAFAHRVVQIITQNLSNVTISPQTGQSCYQLGF